jgi:hypothetical protein
MLIDLMLFPVDLVMAKDTVGSLLNLGSRNEKRLAFCANSHLEHASIGEFHGVLSIVRESFLPPRPSDIHDLSTAIRAVPDHLLHFFSE